MNSLQIKNQSKQLQYDAIKVAMNDPDRMKNVKEAFNILNLIHTNKFGINPDWANIPMKDKMYHGFLKPYLFVADAITTGRWNYWLDIMVTQQVEGKPIPQLCFAKSNGTGYRFTAAMLKDCMSYGSRNVSNFYDFIDWLLYAYGSSLVTNIDHIPEEQTKYWYENYQAHLLLMFPADYFVPIAAELYDNKSFNANSFYPTPPHIVDLMVKMTFDEKDEEVNKYAAYYDPCCGTGIMPLYASNHTLRIYCQDIDPTMIKLATLNGFNYIPWLVQMNEKTSALLSRMHDKYNLKTAASFDEEKYAKAI
jgi:hypothetical protein